MTDFILIDGVSNEVANTPEALFTSTNDNGTKIKTFVAYNSTGINRSFKVFIGNTVKAVIPLKILIRNKTYIGSEVIGQVLKKGQSLFTESSLEDSIEFRSTGENQ